MRARDPAVETFLISVRDALAARNLGPEGSAAIDRIYQALAVTGPPGSGQRRRLSVCEAWLAEALATARRHSPAMARIVDAFEVGYLKMRAEYWPICQRLIGFEPKRTLYLDDDESCLNAAQAYGINHIFHSAKSSSQLPPQRSERFRSIESLAAFIQR